MFQFLIQYQTELSFFFIGTTTVMIIFALLQWVQIRDKSLWIYALACVAIVIYFLRYTIAGEGISAYLDLRENDFLRYTEITLGVGMVLSYILFIYYFLNFNKHFSKKVLAPIKVFFGIMILVILMDWYFLFVTGDMQMSLTWQLYFQPFTIIFQLYILILTFKLKGVLSRIVSFGYLMALAWLPLMLVYLKFENPDQQFFPQAHLNSVGNKIFTLGAQFGLFLENLFFLYAFVFRIRLFQKQRDQASLAMERKQQETKQLQEIQAQKNQFFTNITHEFRTPLTVISGIANQGLKYPEKWSATELRMIQRNTGQLLELVNQMLDLARLDVKNLTIVWIQSDLVAYLRYLMESFHAFAETNSIDLQLTTTTEKLIMDYDPQMIKSIVNNLLSNAIKFTQPGGKVLLSVNKHQENGRTFCVIRISDSGVGIPKHQLPHIFDRFYQVDQTTTRKTEGTGLGLALAKELINLLGGKIEVESKLDNGTTFTTSLPIYQNAPLKSFPIMDPKESSHSYEVSFNDFNHTDLYQKQPDSKPIALIVEDNRDVLHYLTTCLQPNYKVTIARNGKKGLERAIQLVPDIIISDVMMPEMDGFELCNQIKAHQIVNHIPIILLTAKADQASKKQGLASGADAYLIKPFDQEELEIRLEKLIEIRHQLKEKYGQIKLASHPIPSEVDPNFQFLKKLESILLENIATENFRIDPDLCRAMAMSRPQLYRKLKALTDQSPSEYFRSIRMQKAKQLLQVNNPMSVRDVAQRVGFKHHSHFTRVYVDYFAELPSETLKPRNIGFS